MIHVSAPTSDMVDKYVCMRAVKCGRLSSSGRTSDANLVWESVYGPRKQVYGTSVPSIVVRVKSGDTVSATKSYPRHHSVEEKGRTWIRLFSRSVHLAARGMRAKAGGRRLTKVFLCRITSFAAVVLGQLGPDTHEVCVTADGPDGGGQQAKEPEEQHRSAVVSRVQGWRCCT